MIKSFKSNALKRFSWKDDGGKVSPEHIDKVWMILTALDDAEVIDDLKIVTFRLHPLKGDRQGEWSITVRANWRVTFRMKDGHVYDVEYEDYH